MAMQPRDTAAAEAIAAIQKIAKEKLPKGYDYEWKRNDERTNLSGNPGDIYFYHLPHICILIVSGAI